MNNTQLTFSFIGAGNMSGAILAGMLKNGINPDQIIATNRSEDKQAALSEQYGVTTNLTNQEAIQKADVVILGVKPQMMADVLKDVLEKGVKFDNKLVITVAGGLHCQFYTQLIGDVRFIRSMPNTPSMVGLGMAGLFNGSNRQMFSASQIDADNQIAELIFSAVGKYVWLNEESQIDDIAAVSGSGPAYYFFFMEAMIDKAKQLGFSEEVATLLVKQTALGASKMSMDQKTPVAQLRKNVTSPGGTTAMAIAEFERRQLRQIVDDALDATIVRAKELSKI